VESGLLHIVLAAGGGDSADIADVFYHGGEGQRHDGEHGGPEHAGVNFHIEQVENTVVPHYGEADPLCSGNFFDHKCAGCGVEDYCENI